MPRPPAAVTSAAVSSIVSGRPGVGGLPRAGFLELRPVQYTLAPAAPSATATPPPAPRVAPATRAILPERVLLGIVGGILLGTLVGAPHAFAALESRPSTKAVHSASSVGR